MHQGCNVTRRPTDATQQRIEPRRCVIGLFVDWLHVQITDGRGAADADPPISDRVIALEGGNGPGDRPHPISALISRQPVADGCKRSTRPPPNSGREQ
jgi:hypothetical protein